MKRDHGYGHKRCHNVVEWSRGIFTLLVLFMAGWAAAQDDALEPNDDYVSATDLRSYRRAWLSELPQLDGAGAIRGFENADYYRLEVPHPDLDRLLLVFESDPLIDIDAVIWGLTKNGNTISFDYPNGLYGSVILDYGDGLDQSNEYYLRIDYDRYLTDPDFQYDIWWNAYDPTSDDQYEPNDAQATAFDLRSHEGQWLSQLNGPGIQRGADWYHVQIPYPSRGLACMIHYARDATYNDNLVLALFDAAGTLKDYRVGADENLMEQWATKNDSAINNEAQVIRFTQKDLEPGDYYVAVGGAGIGQWYDLYWKSFNEQQDPYENGGADFLDIARGSLRQLLGPGAQEGRDEYRMPVRYYWNNDVYYETTVQLDSPLADNAASLELRGGQDALLSHLEPNGRDWLAALATEVYDPSIGMEAPTAIVEGDNLGAAYDLLWCAKLDDWLEENDTSATAKVVQAEGWLSAQGGPLRLWDEDWYEIEIPEGASFPLRLAFQLEWNAEQSEPLVLDLRLLYDFNGSTGQYIPGGARIEDVMTITAPGRYLLGVQRPEGADYTGTLYNLSVRWLEDVSDDVYEICQAGSGNSRGDNDTPAGAFNMSADNFTDRAPTAQSISYFSSFEPALQWDDDYYVFYAPENRRRIRLSASFTHADGDIDIQLLDSQLNVVAQSRSVTDDEFIDYIAPSAGRYFVRVFYGDAGNEYNLSYELFDADDDLAEDNDLFGDAKWTLREEGWVGADESLIQRDEDWFSLKNSGSDQFFSCIFDNNEGEIWLEVYDADENLIAQSTPGAGIQSIDTSLGSRLLVRGNNQGTHYHFWHGVRTVGDPDDFMEENDERTSAFDLNTAQGVFVSNYFGKGRQYDEDWYAITVPISTEPTRLMIECQFSHAEGNLSLVLYDPTGLEVGRSNTSNDNERLSTTFSPGAGGDYTVLVTGPNLGTEYDLWWDTGVSALEPQDDVYEDNDTPQTPHTLTGDGGAAGRLSDENGTARSFDVDYYQLPLPVDAKGVVEIRCEYVSGGGALLRLRIYDDSGGVIADSVKIPFVQELLAQIEAPGAGSLLLEVTTASGPSAAIYDLTWSFPRMYLSAQTPWDCYP